MRPVADHDEVMRAIAEVKPRGTGYLTSFFASPAKVEEWARAGILYVMRSEQALLILRRDGRFLRVYHVASDTEALHSSLAALVGGTRDGLLVADLVGRSQDMHEVLQTYQDQGFRSHARLDRMQHGGFSSFATVEASDVSVAGERDVAAIRGFMEHWLDPLAEQIQTQAELSAAVAAGEALVVRASDELAGFLIFETTGQSSVLRYWHVEPRQRGRGVGARLMRAFMSRCSRSQRIVLWVLAQNADAIARYKHYGFRNDGVMDQIMTRQT